MKAINKVCTAERQFNEDQKRIMKRVALVLIEHNLSVAIVTKVKKYKKLNLKVS